MSIQLIDPVKLQLVFTPRPPLTISDKELQAILQDKFNTFVASPEFEDILKKELKGVLKSTISDDDLESISLELHVEVVKPTTGLGEFFCCDIETAIRLVEDARQVWDSLPGPVKAAIVAYLVKKVPKWIAAAAGSAKAIIVNKITPHKKDSGTKCKKKPSASVSPKKRKSHKKQ
jgi:hypothetical protein